MAWVDKAGDLEGEGKSGQGRKGRAADKPGDDRPRLCVCKGCAKLSLPSFSPGTLQPQGQAGSVTTSEDIRQSA